jgi:hypothetical protein
MDGYVAVRCLHATQLGDVVVVAFRREVKFLHEVEPNLMYLNGAEFGRVVGLFEATLPTIIEAESRVEWQSGAAELYRRRMKEAELLAHELREGFSIASQALIAYAEALARAKAEFERGEEPNDALGALIRALANTQSEQVKDSEPLSQWEDLRKMTGFWDRVFEKRHQDEIDEIRAEADALYYEAAGAYSQARDIERAARQECVAEMRRAFKALPDFKANSAAAEDIVALSPDVMHEMAEAAATNDQSRLPGQGRVPAFGVDGGDLSDPHKNIQIWAAGLDSEQLPGWDTYDALRGKLDPEYEQAYKWKWIEANRGLIEAAAREYGIPPDVLAGIMYQEVGGKPPITDHGGDWLRRHGLASGDPDDTSYGPMGIQVDTGAVALGYDPNNLTDKQREEVIKSLEDPEQSVIIAAMVLGNEKDASDFAGVEPENMTPEQERELAARYNGGPDYDGPIAQGYGDNYTDSRDEVAKRLYGN